MCTCPTKFGSRGASGRGTPANMCQAYTSVYGWGKIHSLKGCSVSTVVYIAIYSLRAIRDSKYVCYSICQFNVHKSCACAQIVVSPFISVMKQNYAVSTLTLYTISD